MWQSEQHRAQDFAEGRLKNYMINSFEIVKYYNFLIDILIPMPVVGPQTWP